MEDELKQKLAKRGHSDPIEGAKRLASLEHPQERRFSQDVLRGLRKLASDSIQQAIDYIEEGLTLKDGRNNDIAELLIDEPEQTPKIQQALRLLKQALPMARGSGDPHRLIDQFDRIMINLIDDWMYMPDVLYESSDFEDFFSKLVRKGYSVDDDDDLDDLQDDMRELLEHWLGR